jgi:YidC/Oxa1 family membrane protein insertase
MGFIEIWHLVLGNPVLNVLIALSHFLFGQFGLAIIALTIIVRLVTWPLNKRQLNSAKAAQEIQPKLQELQKKYGRNQQKLQQETMKLYREAGVNPLGCLWPMLVQFPIWIALYQAIMNALATTPTNLLNLASRLYSWDIVNQAIPLSSQFLGLDLGQTGGAQAAGVFLAIVVGGTMWVQQKMTQAPSTDPRQQSTTRMMTLMMPLMFGFLTLMLPSGLALYWAVSNIIGIITQYFVTGGWGYLKLGSLFQSTSVRRK